MITAKIIIAVLFTVAVTVGVYSLFDSIAVGRSYALDGATLVLGDEVIEIDGLVSPKIDEMCKVAEKEWPCGWLAASSLSQLVRDRSIWCWGKKELPNGRLAAVCYGGVSDIGRRQVLQGWAVIRDEKKTRYFREQEAARHQRIGMWKLSARRG